MKLGGWRQAPYEQASSSRTGYNVITPRVSVEPVPSQLESQAKLKGYVNLADQRAALRNQYVREGHFESKLMERQANKIIDSQGSIKDYLKPYDESVEAVVAVVGCGPAGLALSSCLAREGVAVVIVGPDKPFVNNYGVWVDEFEELGLAHTLSHTWEQTLCYFGENRKELNRGYGKVDGGKLRQELLHRCQSAGVRYLCDEVVDVEETAQPGNAVLHLKSGAKLQPKLNVLATGQLAGRYLQYETNAPSVASQTAYGIEADVEGYGDAFDPACMLFMDYRRHHTGVWEKGGISEGGLSINGPPALGASGEVPSFLYAMPLTPQRVFLEETCLVARPALPFAVLKRRLMRRLDALGIKVLKVHDEEWSYIPVGGPLPVRGQSVTAFGAAANLVHPATGYSITRSLQEAPSLAAEIAKTVTGTMAVGDVASVTWEKLWPTEKRKQASFHVFGMELFTNMDLELLSDFFAVFFRLPDFYWRGFLASRLSSVQLMAFALLCFGTASNKIRAALVRHLFADPSGSYMAMYFTTEIRQLIDKVASKADVKEADDSMSMSKMGGDAGSK